MDSNGVHARVLKELADIPADLPQLFMNSVGNLEKSQSTGIWQIVSNFKEKKAQERRPWVLRPVSPTWVPGKIMESIILGDTEKHLKNNAVISEIQHGFMK